MKSQETCLIGRGLIVLVVLLTALHIEVCAEGQEKQWVAIHDQIAEESSRYSFTLRYVPSESTFYTSSRSSIQSFALPEGEQTDGYTERIDFGAMVDGSRYSALLSDAREFRLIHPDGRQFGKAKILRSDENDGSEVIREGYFFLGNQIQIPFEVQGQNLGLPTHELVPGTFSFNIHSHSPHFYQGSFSTHLKGILRGSASVDGASLQVLVSYKESLQPNHGQIQLTLQPFDEEETPYDSVRGKLTDTLKLRSAKLVVEKVASDNSEIVLAVVHGNFRQMPKKEESHLRVGEPVPTFARVDLVRRELLTLDELRKKAKPKGHIVLIFADLRREPLDYHYRGRQTNTLTLDETMILEILQRDLKTPVVVVFVCQRFFFSDLYGKWLGEHPDFHIIPDCSEPMNVQFWFPFRDQPHYRRPPERMETLRKQLALPENKMCVLVMNGKGNLVYIETDAEAHLTEALTEINRLMRDSKLQ
ncbi:MAG: hypothetical protein ACYSUC_05125 [Planctomycetota bacterium]|jgi:hypothetical protein